jgi:hypothetical protein
MRHLNAFARPRTEQLLAPELSGEDQTSRHPARPGRATFLWVDEAGDGRDKGSATNALVRMGIRKNQPVLSAATSG